LIAKTWQSQSIAGFLFLRSNRRLNKLNGFVSRVQITRTNREMQKRKRRR